MSHEHVKDRISSAVGSDGDTGILFDETIAAYNFRRKAAEEYLVTALLDSHQKAFRPYLSTPQWTTISSDLNSEQPLRGYTDNYEMHANRYQLILPNLQ